MDEKTAIQPQTMPGLTEGRIVHYVLPDGPYAGEHRPAIIVRVWNHSTGYCNLTLFPDWQNDGYQHGVEWKTSIDYSAEPKPNTWHFVEKA